MRADAAIAGAQEGSRKRYSNGWKDAALHLRSLHTRRWNHSTACEDSTLMQKNRVAWRDRDLHDQDFCWT